MQMHLRMLLLCLMLRYSLCRHGDLQSSSEYDDDASTGSDEQESEEEESLEDGMLEVTNKYRTQNNMESLSTGDGIRKVAQKHARYMCKSNKLTHESPGGDLKERLKRHNLNSVKYGANIAEQENDDYREVARVWMGSSSHKGNILGDYTHTAIATCRARKGHSRFWIQVYSKAVSNKSLPSIDSIDKLQRYLQKGYTGTENREYVLLLKPKHGETSETDGLQDGKSADRPSARPDSPSHSSGHARDEEDDEKPSNSKRRPREHDRKPASPRRAPDTGSESCSDGKDGSGGASNCKKSGKPGGSQNKNPEKDPSGSPGKWDNPETIFRKYFDDCDSDNCKTQSRPASSSDEDSLSRMSRSLNSIGSCLKDPNCTGLETSHSHSSAATERTDSSRSHSQSVSSGAPEDADESASVPSASKAISKIKYLTTTSVVYSTITKTASPGSSHTKDAVSSMPSQIPSSVSTTDCHGSSSTKTSTTASSSVSTQCDDSCDSKPVTHKTTTTTASSTTSSSKCSSKSPSTTTSSTTTTSSATAQCTVAMGCGKPDESSEMKSIAKSIYELKDVFKEFLDSERKKHADPPSQQSQTASPAGSHGPGAAGQPAQGSGPQKPSNPSKDYSKGKHRRTDKPEQNGAGKNIIIEVTKDDQPGDRQNRSDSSRDEPNSNGRQNKKPHKKRRPRRQDAPSSPSSRGDDSREASRKPSDLEDLLTVRKEVCEYAKRLGNRQEGDELDILLLGVCGGRDAAQHSTKFACLLSNNCKPDALGEESRSASKTGPATDKPSLVDLLKKLLTENNVQIRIVDPSQPSRSRTSDDRRVEIG